MKIAIAIGFVLLSLVLIKWRRQSVLPLTIAYLFAIIDLAFISREPAPYLRYNISIFGAVRRGIQFGGRVTQGLLNDNVKVVSWTSIVVLCFISSCVMANSLYSIIAGW